jgi:hypothetical protein
MSFALPALLWAACVLGQPVAEVPPSSFVEVPACRCGRGGTMWQPYVPCEGDLVFFWSHSVFWRSMFILAHSGPPYHVGLVVLLPDGRPALLEAGLDSKTRQVYLNDILPRLREYHGEVWIRRRCRPLTPEQSAGLTAFATGQEGKDFALWRMALQATPLRPRGPLRSRLFGKVHGERDSYFCSELVCEAGIAAGLLNPEVVRPNVTFPRDLFDDETLDLSPGWLKPVRWHPGCGGAP